MNEELLNIRSYIIENFSSSEYISFNVDKNTGNILLQENCLEDIKRNYFFVFDKGRSLDWKLDYNKTLLKKLEFDLTEMKFNKLVIDRWYIL